MKKFKHSQLSEATRKNIYSLYAISFLNGALFWYAIEQLLIEDLGGGVLEKGLSVAMFVFVFGVVNIPIGAFADRKGRRLSLILGLVAYLIGIYLFAISPNIYFFIIVNIPISLSVAFFDGAVESMVYDSLADDGHENAYSKVSGRLEASVFGGAMIANVASGFIAEWLGVRANYYLSLIPVSVGLLVALFILKEPEHHKDTTQTIKQKMNLALSEIKTNKSLLYIIVSIVALFILHDLVEEFSQPFFTSLSSSAVGLSMFWAAIAGGATIGQLAGHKLKPYLSKIIITVSVLIVIFMAVSGWAALAMLPLFFAVVHAGLNGLEAEMQDNSKSHLRSTIGSVYGTVIALVLIPLFIFGGYLGEVISVNRVVAIIGIPLTLTALIYFIKFSRS